MEKPVLVVLALGSLGRPGLGRRGFFPASSSSSCRCRSVRVWGTSTRISTSKSPLREPLG